MDFNMNSIIILIAIDCTCICKLICSWNEWLCISPAGSGGGGRYGTSGAAATQPTYGGYGNRGGLGLANSWKAGGGGGAGAVGQGKEIARRLLELGLLFNAISIDVAVDGCVDLFLC
jgi:hypothetical protein